MCALWPNSAVSHTITTVMATAKRYSPAVKVSPHMESGAHYRVRPRPRPRIFTWLCCSQQSRRQKHARYESIHKAAQYKNSGAIETGIINESEMITAGVKEDFQCLRRAAHRKEMRTKLHYLANAEESEAAARKYCDDSTARFRF